MISLPPLPYIDPYKSNQGLYEQPVSYSKNTISLRFEVKPAFVNSVRILNHIDQIFERMNAIANLPENWNGQGASIINRQTLQNSLKFLSIVGENITMSLDSENIMPTPYGTIELEWRTNDKLLSIEIGINKIGFFSQFPDQNNPHSNGFLFNGIKIPRDLTQAFIKFFQA